MEEQNNHEMLHKMTRELKSPNHFLHKSAGGRPKWNIRTRSWEYPLPKSEIEIGQAFHLGDRSQYKDGK